MLTLAAFPRRAVGTDALVVDPVVTDVTSTFCLRSTRSIGITRIFDYNKIGEDAFF